MNRCFRKCCGFLVVTLAFPLQGCQTWVEKTTPGNGLPSGTYLQKPPQYVPPTPPFPITREVAQLQAAPPGATQMPSTPVGTAPTPAQTAPPRSRRVEVKDGYLAELLDILDETKSVDAFLVTLNLLAEAGPEAKAAVPTAIRNAERLGLYGKDTLTAEGRQGELARQVTERIEQMGKGQSAAKTKGFSETVEERLESLQLSSEELRQIQAEWRRFWMSDQPSHLTPERVHGGIGPGPSAGAAQPAETAPTGKVKSKRPATPAPNRPAENEKETSREAPACPLLNDGAPNAFDCPLTFEGRERDDGCFLRLGTGTLPGLSSCLGRIARRDWGTVESSCVALNLSECDLVRHQLVILPPAGLVSDFYLASTPLGAFSAELRSGGWPLHARGGICWYPMEGVALTFGLDPLRGLDVGCALIL